MVAQKLNLPFLRIKHELYLNKGCYKVSFCENFLRHTCKIIPQLNNVWMFARKAKLQPNISAQIDTPLQKALTSMQLGLFCHRHDS